MTNSDEFVTNSKVRRLCMLEHNANLRRTKDEINLQCKIFERRSRSFSQGILLYLAEKSQMRHQRQQRIGKITKMFRVALDEAEPSTSVSKLPSLKKTVTVLENKKTEDGDRQSMQRSCSIASETSSIEEAFRRATLRSRARSIGVIQEKSEMPRRRLSAPEVVITTVKPEKQINDNLDYSSQHQSTLEKMETLSTISSPLRLSSSTFKTYSRTSPFLLRRLGSQDSSSVAKRRPPRQESIPSDEVLNPLLDQRFVNLLTNLHRFSKHENDVDSTKKTTVA